MSKSNRVLKLRAHHICCLPFAEWDFKERGAAFQQAKDVVKGILLSQPDVPVMVSEGPDELCQHCTLLVNGGCASPKGDENTVRRWDAILMKELGLSFETCLTSGEWQSLIKQKSPFQLCQRCQWRQTCRQGANLK